MTTGRQRLSNSIRIIWAVAAKDILDAIKNRSILPLIATALFLVLYDTLMPPVRYGNRPPILALYDAGESGLVDLLDENEDVDLRVMSSRQELEWYLGGEQAPVLGLVLPANLDQTTEDDVQLELEGYVDHWVSESTIVELKAFFEQQFTELTDRATSIQVESDRVLSRAAGAHAWSVAGLLTAIITLLGLVVTPILMIEEKETRTMDVLLTSPASAAQLVIGKAMAGMFYCLVGSVIVLLLNSSLVVHWETAVLATIGGSLFSVSLGLLMGSAIRIKQQLNIVSWFILFPLMLAVPAMDILTTSVAPDRLGALRTIIALLPTSAVGKLIRLSVTSSAPAAVYGPQVALLAGYIVVLLAAVTWAVKRSDR
jgi:ABC-type transport system involved in multi-copper enzyme maturation permease subunit